MGWSSGTKIMSDIIDTIKPRVEDPESRRYIYHKIIMAFEVGDWDTQSECMGRDAAFDAALKDLHPSWFDDAQPPAE